MNSREIIKKLKNDGWVLHLGKVTVPHPSKDMAIGTLKSIYNQAGWDWK